jgi:hypothetical protein
MWNNDNNERRWKVYNYKPSEEELRKQKEDDDTYRFLFWVFFIYTLLDTVFSLF